MIGDWHRQGGYYASGCMGAGETGCVIFKSVPYAGPYSPGGDFLDSDALDCTMEQIEYE